MTSTMTTSISISTSPPTAASNVPSATVLPPSNALSTGILAAVILAGFALVALTGLGVWLYQRRSRKTRSSSKPPRTGRIWPKRHKRPYSQQIADDDDDDDVEHNWHEEISAKEMQCEPPPPAGKRESTKFLGRGRARGRDRNGGGGREKQFKVEKPEFAAISQGRGSTYEGI